ncbi:hypothetical protein [Luteipulveratus flavus]|uniref:Protoporphyrinogen oxidase n=1 Tax=Luteipulveratus flavus TaxID=3031728 RepID=A0ABT6CB12_9MICO|nr:hypothetical protein [Luteipulveratus sp. YIM 133296]MDF8266078.1 hypothetical protein [Luteipulveratus sp. YIM 133296]
MRKLSLVVFGAGYVLGTKAGRQRYDQIAAAARAVSTRLDAYANGSSRAQDDDRRASHAADAEQ